MHRIIKLRQNRLKETEEGLVLMGLGKCSVCSCWMDNDYIKENKCHTCGGVNE